MTNIIKLDNQKEQLNHLKTLARIATESKQYANMNETSLLNLMLSAHDLGISPMKAINGGFYVVNGKVCMSTSLMADRIRKAGHSIKIIEMSKEKCVIIGKRKDNDDSLKLEYTWEDASLAGLTSSSTWKKFPKIMLYNRCMSSVARILFSDVIGNSYSEEERFDIEDVPPEKRPLENPEDEVTIEHVQIEDKLTDEEFGKLDVLLMEDQEAIPIIKKNLRLEDHYQMDREGYNRTIAFLERRKQERNRGQADVA